MDYNENAEIISENQTPEVKPGTYSPVTVRIQDSWGALILGILSLILLIGWMRAEERIRALLAQLSL